MMVNIVLWVAGYRLRVPLSAKSSRMNQQLNIKAPANDFQLNANPQPATGNPKLYSNFQIEMVQYLCVIFPDNHLIFKAYTSPVRQVNTGFNGYQHACLEAGIA